MRYTMITILAAGVIAGQGQSAADWPQLFGATRNAKASAVIAPTAKLSVGWKRSMPSGGAAMVVMGDRLYTLGTDGEQDILFAIDSASGDDMWRVALGKTHADATANGPNSTPALDGDLLLTVSTT